MGIVQFLRFSVFSGFSDFWSRPKKKRIPKKKRLKGTPGISRWFAPKNMTLFGSG